MNIKTYKITLVVKISKIVWKGMALWFLQCFLRGAIQRYGGSARKGIRGKHQCIIGHK